MEVQLIVFYTCLVLITWLPRSFAVVDCNDHSDGLPFPNPDDCSSFHQCAGGILYTISCGELYFNPVTNACDFPANVDCGGQTTTTTTSGPFTGSKIFACYYGSWARTSSSNPYMLRNQDAFLCTHILVAFAVIDGAWPFDIHMDIRDDESTVLPHLTNIRNTINNDLKIMVALGGARFGVMGFERVAENAAYLAQFTLNAVAFVRRFDLDGLDLDWEFPRFPNQFTAMVESLRLAFDDSETLHPELRRLQLTAAVSAGRATIDRAYDVPAISLYLDYILVMTYDFNGDWSFFTAYNSPLYRRPEETDWHRELNLDYAIDYWISKGAPKRILVAGVPSYGHNFQLITSDTGWGAPFDYYYPPTSKYIEVCSDIKTPGSTRVWDEYSLVPYYFRGVRWTSYDDVWSAMEKGLYVKHNFLAGAMVWSLEQDDFSDSCGQGIFPLINSAKSAMLDEPNDVTTVKTTSTTTTPPTTTTTHTTMTEPTTTKQTTTEPTTTKTTTTEPTTITPKTTTTTTCITSIPEPTCVDVPPYFKPVPCDCARFVQCSAFGDLYNMICSSGLYFQPSIGGCNWKFFVMQERTDCA